MLTDLLAAVQSDWEVLALSSAAIFLAVYSMNLFGDLIRERLDPRL